LKHRNGQGKSKPGILKNQWLYSTVRVLTSILGLRAMRSNSNVFCFRGASHHQMAKCSSHLLYGAPLRFANTCSVRLLSSNLH